MSKRQKMSADDATRGGAPKPNSTKREPALIPGESAAKKPRFTQVERDLNRRITAIAMLIGVSLGTVYFLLPVVAYNFEFASKARALILAFGFMTLGALASLYYLRTGRLPYNALRELLSHSSVSASTGIQEPPVSDDAVDNDDAIEGVTGNPRPDSLDASQPYNAEREVHHVLAIAMIQTSRRLQNEIPALGIRSNLNLTFGFFLRSAG